jgi:hypothetical protein
MRSLSRARTAGAAAFAVSIAGCTTAIGLSDYTFRAGGADGGPADASSATLPDRSGPPDAATGDAGVGVGPGGPDAADAISCSVDLSMQCYPCAPATQPQFLNACTSAACVAFDDTRVTLLLPDGGLPPLPTQAKDGGTP